MDGECLTDSLQIDYEENDGKTIVNRKRKYTKEGKKRELEGEQKRDDQLATKISINHYFNHGSVIVLQPREHRQSHKQFTSILFPSEGVFKSLYSQRGSNYSPTEFEHNYQKR